MIILGFFSILFTAPSLNLPAFTGLVVDAPVEGNIQWSLFPILFVTVACGACSGFHALVASGTTLFIARLVIFVSTLIYYAIKCNEDIKDYDTIVG